VHEGDGGREKERKGDRAGGGRAGGQIGPEQKTRAVREASEKEEGGKEGLMPR